MKKALLFAFLVVALPFFRIDHTSALDCKSGAGGVSLSPISQDFSFKTGEVYDGKVTVKNISSDSDSKYRVYTSPFSANKDNNEKDFVTKKDHTQISEWIRFIDGDELVPEIIVSVPACSEMEVSYKVNIPESVPDGSQHAVIFVETYKNELNGGINAVSRAGMIVTGIALDGETIEKSEITNVSINNGTLNDKTGIFAQVEAKNDGNVDAALMSTMTIENIFGQELWRDELNAVVMPDSSYKGSVMWDNVPFIGLFKVKYMVSIQGSESEEFTQIVFVCPLPVLIVVLGLVVIVVWGIIVGVKKRRIRKAKFGF